MKTINLIIILISSFYAISYLLIKKSFGVFSRRVYIYTFIIFIGLCFPLQKLGLLVNNKFEKNKETYIYGGLNISGDWCLFSSNNKAKIIHIDKNNYQIINERNMVSSGHLIGNNRIVAEEWGELVGELQLIDRIVWNNGTTWMRCK